MPINVKRPTYVDILTFMSRIKLLLSCVEHEKSFITSRPDFGVRREKLLSRVSNVVLLLLLSVFGESLYGRAGFCSTANSPSSPV